MGRRRRRTCSCSTPSGRLRYRGAPDSDYDDRAQRAAWLREALDAVLGGASPRGRDAAGRVLDQVEALSKR